MQKFSKLLTAISLFATGAVAGLMVGNGQAQVSFPTKHKGLTIVALGTVPEDSIYQQIGLAGYKLQLRQITIAPGGEIARHSHDSRPGLVKVISGVWTEGRPAGKGGTQAYTHATEISWPERSRLGETDVSAEAPEAILEDRETVHWFYNRTDRPATALVCDIVPAG